MSASEPTPLALATRPTFIRRVYPVLATGFVIGVIWWLLSVWLDKLPSPITTVAHLWEMTTSGQAGSIFLRITIFMAICFSIAAVLGVSFGLLLSNHPAIDRGLSPYLAALQGMPTSMWIPVAAVVLGATPMSLAGVVTIGAMPAIIIGTRNAIGQVPPLLLRAGKTFGADGTTLLRRVVLPAALPGILTGLELGWSIAFRCLVAGEIFSGALSGTGIGDVIAESRESGELTEMMATILIVLIFTLLVDRLVFAKVQWRLRQSRGLVDVGLPH